MAVHDIDELAEHLPEVFDRIVLPDGWDEDLAFAPLDNPLDEVPADILGAILDSLGDQLLDPRVTGIDLPDAIRGEFPGAFHDTQATKSEAAEGPTGRSGKILPPVPPPDCLAFYLPFHYFYPDWWGVYLVLKEIAALARFIYEFDPVTLSQQDAFLAAQAFTYGHEYFHHKVESFATRLEVTHRLPVYKDAFATLFKKSLGTPDCHEEALATSFGFRKAREPFLKDRNRCEAVEAAVWTYIRWLPVGYREAQGILWPADARRAEQSFAEENHRAAFPLKPNKEGSLWLMFPHAFDGIGRRTSRVNYVIRRSSPLAERMQLDLRYLRPREVIKMLKDAGCEFVRPGKGSHEIWRAPDGTQFPVPRHPGDLASGTLQSILKKAGVA